MAINRGAIWKFVTLDCRKMHLRATEQLKIPFKDSLTMNEIFDKSNDMVLKLHENRRQTQFPWSLVVPA